MNMRFNYLIVFIFIFIYVFILFSCVWGGGIFFVFFVFFNVLSSVMRYVYIYIYIGKRNDI